MIVQEEAVVEFRWKLYFDIVSTSHIDLEVCAGAIFIKCGVLGEATRVIGRARTCRG